jgi:hypothetical protein
MARHPRRVGKPLVGELTEAVPGEATAGTYEIDDDRKVVIVHRVHHRRILYRRR